jgi:hypothetical protein
MEVLFQINTIHSTRILFDTFTFMKLYLLSGFLGSGKTTAIFTASKLLVAEGREVGIITNDQGNELVDTAYLNRDRLMIKEVNNGCFCCRFDELEKQLNSLIDRRKPEIIFAETVGSCADLIATVVKPLGRSFPLEDIILSVFADASMLWPVIKGETFFLSEDVRYIYQKQLEEADLIVLNKADLLSNEQRAEMTIFLKKEYPGKVILVQDSTNEDSVRIWYSVLERFRPNEVRSSLDIDYDRYARGEQVLAWLDERLVILSTDGSASVAAHHFIRDVQRRIHKAGLPIGHLKFLLDDDREKRKYSYTTISGSGPFPEANPEPSDHVEILVNARVQADPEMLDDLVKAALLNMKEQFPVEVNIISSQAFQPEQPRPIHRIPE